VAFYPTDNLRLDLSAIYLQGPGGSIASGVEWAPDGTSMSFFADASASSSSNWSAVAGLKMYFGGTEKSLIRRHREDDPENLLPDDLYKSVGPQYCSESDFVDVDGLCDGFG
jgi:hypothetical protein